MSTVGLASLPRARLSRGLQFYGRPRPRLLNFPNKFGKTVGHGLCQLVSFSQSPSDFP
jgi:hypothetical protein